MSTNLLGKCADLCSQKISASLTCNICRIFEKCRHLSFDLMSLKASMAKLVWENLCSSCVQTQTRPCSFIAFITLFFFLSLTLSVCFSPSLPVASGNKGLTGRAWRSWSLDSEGESHSWVGQASTSAKVMSCVHWGGGVLEEWVLIWHCFFFFLSLWPPGLVREKPPGPFDEVQGVSKTEGWWLWASQEVEILSKHCVFVYVSSSNIPRGVHTCCFFSSVWASVTKVAKDKLFNMQKHSQFPLHFNQMMAIWALYVLYWKPLLISLYWKHSVMLQFYIKHWHKIVLVFLYIKIEIMFAMQYYILH